MTNKTFSFKQRKFPFELKEIIVDPIKRKLTVINQSLFKRESLEEDLHNVDDKYQEFKDQSFGWYMLAIIATIYFIGCLYSWTYKAPKSTDEMGFTIFCQCLLFMGVWYSWLKAYQSKINIVYFRFKNINYHLTLFRNKPNKVEFENFIDKFQETISLSQHSQTIQSIIEQIPTEVLVNEFSTSVMKELARRDIDVQGYLLFLRNTLNNKPA